MISVPTGLSGGPCDELLVPVCPCPVAWTTIESSSIVPVRTHSQRSYVFLDVVDDVSHCVEPVRPLE